MLHKQPGLWVFAALTLASSPSLGASAPTQDPIAICTRHLQAIGRALTAYRHDHHELPPNLSDLYPRYIKDAALFHCPADPTTGEPGYVGAHPDPNMAISYLYEMSLQPDPAGQLLGPDPPNGIKTWRDLKSAQRRNFGDRVPVIRCWHHPAHPDSSGADDGSPSVLNLTLSGQVYRSIPSWEYDPLVIPVVVTLMERDLKAGLRLFRTRWAPARAADYFGGLTQVAPELGARIRAIADQLDTAGNTSPSMADSGTKTLVGSMYHSAGFTAKAVSAFEKAIRTPGNHNLAATLLAGIYHDTGKDDQSIRFLQELLVREPDSALYMQLLSHAYADDGQQDKADEWQGKVNNWLIGQSAPDFTLKDARGKVIRFSERRGKVTLLFFWSASDSSSWAEASSLEELNKKYRSRGLVVLSLNEEAMHGNAKGVARSYFTYPLLLDAGAVFRAYGILDVPTTYLIDGLGKVVLRHVGFDGRAYLTLDQAIERLLPSQTASLRRSIRFLRTP